jgi:hypothetical protein
MADPGRLQYHLALPELAQMRFAILRWYDSSASLQPPKAASAISASPLTSAHVLSLPLPPTTFFDPPTLTEAISQTTTLRPLAHEIIPLVLLVQQFTLGCLFRMQVTPEDAKRRPEVVCKYLLGDGGPLSWRKLLGGIEVGESGAEMEAIWKRVDGMMTSMFGTVTNGCIGMDLDSRESPRPCSVHSTDTTLRQPPTSCCLSALRRSFSTHQVALSTPTKASSTSSTTKLARYSLSTVDKQSATSSVPPRSTQPSRTSSCDYSRQSRRIEARRRASTGSIYARSLYELLRRGVPQVPLDGLSLMPF